MTEEEMVKQAYESGRTTFLGIEMLVAPGVLVPRAETEMLADTAVRVLTALDSPSPRVIDMCCGSGNLACAIARHAPGSRIWASDSSAACAEVARRNVDFLSVGDRVFVHEGDLFGSLAGLDLEGSIDVIVCNPPYISTTRLDRDRAHLLELEPREAFAAGPYGLSIHLRVVKDAAAFLRPGGLLLFEVGLGQDRQVSRIFERSTQYEGIRVVQNEAGEGRVVSGRLKA